MYCARCGKNIAKSDPRVWAVLPGRNRPVPTCYDDRICEVHKISTVAIPSPVKPVVVFISCRLTFVRIENKIRGWGKYQRRYKFYGRWMSWK